VLAFEWGSQREASFKTYPRLDDDSPMSVRLNIDSDKVKNLDGNAFYFSPDLAIGRGAHSTGVWREIPLARAGEHFKT
jgi:hypothetical protein